MNLLTQIRARHAFDDQRALKFLLRQLQPAWLRLAYAMIPGLQAAHQGVWEELVTDLGRSRNSGEIINACRYWRQRRPMSLGRWPHSWFLQVETRRAVLVADRYLPESTAGNQG